MKNKSGLKYAFFVAALGVAAFSASVLVNLDTSHTPNEHDGESLAERIEALDRGYTYMFGSIDKCADGDTSLEDCRASYQEALKIWMNDTETFRYDTEDECLAEHRSCEKAINPQDGHIEFRPVMEAWQTSTQDLRRAVPLLSGGHQGGVIRIDGQRLPSPAR